MSNTEFIGLLFLVGIPTIVSIFKLSISIAKFTVSVDNLLEWQKSKDDKDVEQDRRLNEHEGRLEKIERTNFIKDRI
ncbi:MULTISPECIES: hypothetical protein [Erysipelothrix]|uniref:hypothetical protein n=1 Tax=Erysipelothrix TaxID=1647 RepID=UPI000E05B2EF|nr:MULTISPECIES: hypothetical protein [Erysipelothrix]MBK2401736.1 hypothetical protein [Erysipelothrix sp. strain 2 (EsS2-6-Brazil)]STD01716.1 Uncharacterised protein [Erysipelothrix rhusiopathiae]